MIGARNIKGGMVSDDENNDVYSGYEGEGNVIDKKELLKRGQSDFQALMDRLTEVRKDFNDKGTNELFITNLEETG